jgi:prefoldin subunit 5
LFSSVQASQDLLDPASIGAARKSAANAGLLDPARLAPNTGRPTDGAAATRPRRSGHRDPIEAAGTAASVVASMDTLTNSAASLLDAILKLEASVVDLANKIQKLQDEMVAKMEEYRNGLFCSGCGQTKSEILAKGDQFPHPGQTIIVPTPAQIAAKERELQRPIDELNRELRDVKAKLHKAAGEREEALLQIGYGLTFWRTCITFERVLMQLDDDENAASYKTERARTEDQLSKLKIASLAERDRTAIQRLARETTLWTDIQNNLDTKRTNDRRAAQNALERAASTAAYQKGALQRFLGRGMLRHVVAVVADSSFVSPRLDPNGLGILYRMGAYRVADHDEILPSVQRLIADFRSSAG